MEDFDTASWREKPKRTVILKKKYMETIVMDQKKCNYMVLVWETKTLD